LVHVRTCVHFRFARLIIGPLPHCSKKIVRRTHHNFIGQE
jgi:hypothetical protein